jgi:hypothetical protein
MTEYERWMKEEEVIARRERQADTESFWQENELDSPTDTTESLREQILRARYEDERARKS